MMKNQKTQPDNESVKLELDKLLEKRYGSAVNIHGIRYQLLYSIFRAFDLYVEEKQIRSIRLEGIEEVDIRLEKGLFDEYIQVKTSQVPWKWHQLKLPVKNFLEIYRVEPDCHFVLVVDFQLTKDFAKLAQRDDSLPIEQQEALKNKFLKLCKELEQKKKISASANEANNIFNQLTIISFPEDQLWKQLKQSITDHFKLESEAIDTYLLVLVAKFLEWALTRKTIIRSDLENIQAQVGQVLTRDPAFQTYGRGLIDRVLWTADAKATDFFDGKRTRPDHIVAKVDVKRSLWIEKIKKFFDYSKVCILRSSSGQGKSALLYRYAYDYGFLENTFILKMAESSEQVESTINYLRFRNSLGLPILLLIDNAGWQTRLWPSIVQECATLGIQVLVTVRHEEWYRFARESLSSYEILEPILEFNEAKQIFEAFKFEKRLHISVNSPAWAYEKIGESHLLMEYVYLLTQGQMLEERLREQMSQFCEQKEDPIEIEILRRAALADTLGVPILSRQLLLDEHIQGRLPDDPPQVLKSLDGEYVNLEKGFITGLHAVRSDYLSWMLHKEYPNLCDTALTLFEVVPPNSIVTFVSNALCKEGLDVTLFTYGLIEKAKNVEFDTLLAFIEGIFEAGERQFFKSNKSVFDEAYQLNGSSATFLIMSDLMPVVKVDFINEMVNILKYEKGENLRKLQQISSKIGKTSRGLDWCRHFLSQVTPFIKQQNILPANLGTLGQLLDWCFLCQVTLPEWLFIRDKLIENSQIFHTTLDNFCNFTQGFYRYDERAYHDWFSQNQQKVIDYLKLHTNCVKLNILDSTLYITFVPKTENNTDFKKQVTSRLKKLRSAVPFCEYYQSQGIWDLPVDIKLSIDDTYKNVLKENMPREYESDVRKNLVWKNIVENHYLSESYCKYEKSWYHLRYDALHLVQGLSKGLQKTLTGKKFNFNLVLERGQLFVRLEASLRHLPAYPQQTPAHLKEVLEGPPKRYSTGLRNFIYQLFQYFEDIENHEMIRLAVLNFEDATKSLPELHSAFDQLFKDIPDYFEIATFNDDEIKAYRTLVQLLNTWIELIC